MDPPRALPNMLAEIAKCERHGKYADGAQPIMWISLS